jgi:hypothetical protein
VPGGGQGGGDGGELRAMKAELDAVRQAYENALLTGKVNGESSVKVPSFPTPPQYRQWRHAICIAVAAASGRGEQGYAWCLKAENPEVTFDDLADSEGYDTLDIKLSSALTHLASGDLGLRISLAVDRQKTLGRVLKGRQIVWLVHDHHKLDDERGAMYDYADLQAIKFKGDNNLERFMNTWEMVLQGMTEPPPPRFIELTFYDQLKTSKALETEIGTYERASKPSYYRSYEFLVESVRRYLARKRQDKHRKAIVGALSHASSAAAATTSTTKKSKAKNSTTQPSVPAEKGRGKGKGKGRGKNPPRPPGSDGAICYEYAKTGKCTRPNCKYEHRSGS